MSKYQCQFDVNDIDLRCRGQKKPFAGPLYNHK